MGGSPSLYNKLCTRSARFTPRTPPLHNKLTKHQLDSHRAHGTDELLTVCTSTAASLTTCCALMNTNRQIVECLSTQHRFPRHQLTSHRARRRGELCRAQQRLSRHLLRLHPKQRHPHQFNSHAHALSASWRIAPVCVLADGVSLTTECMHIDTVGAGRPSSPLVLRSGRSPSLHR
jgi:hypothetical protein